MRIYVQYGWQWLHDSESTVVRDKMIVFRIIRRITGLTEVCLLYDDKNACNQNLRTPLS